MSTAKETPTISEPAAASARSAASTEDRTRVIRWQDPSLGPKMWRGKTGLEYLQTILTEGYRPAMGSLMGFELVEVSEGKATFRGLPAEYHYNPMGSVHGGFACTLLDSALGVAIMSTLPAGVGYATVQINVHMVRPLTASTGPVLAEAEIVHAGRRMATAEARLVDEKDRLYAHGTTACALFEAK